LLLIGGATMFAPEAARQRIATTTTEIRRGTLHSRTVIWKAGLRAWRSRPVTGAGAGAYPDVVRPLIGVPGRPGHEYVAHNVFLSVLVETGIVGLALFGLALALLALFVWALRDGDRLVFTAAAAVWLAGAVTLTWEHRKPTWLLPALICSMWVRSFREEGS
jgi:O-antigen ligase